MFSKQTLVKINLFVVTAMDVLMATASMKFGIRMLKDVMSILKLVGVVQVPGIQTGIKWSYVNMIGISLIAACGLLLVVTICSCYGAWKNNAYLL